MLKDEQLQEDVVAYDKVQEICKENFISRFKMHGSHTNKDTFYFDLGIALKGYRLFNDLKTKGTLVESEDSIIDLINYLTMRMTCQNIK